MQIYRIYYPDWQKPEEGRRVQHPKHSDDKNKDDDISQAGNNKDDDKCSSKKFRKKW